MTKFNTISFLCSLFLLSACGDFNNPELDKLTKDIKRTVKRQNATLTTGQLELLAINLGDNVIAPTTLKLHNDVQQFDTDLKEHCEAPSDETNNEILKKSWKNIMTTYHTAAAFIDEENFGIELSLMYSWPTTKAYSTDLRIASSAQRNRPLKLGSDQNKGLDILEYFVFDDDYLITCRTGRKCKRSIKSWNSKSKAERVADRCKYMKLVVDEVLAHTTDLSERWNPKGKSFITEALKDSTFGNLNETIKKFSDALFYFEKSVKDKRVGIPSGRNEECDKDSCPEKSEHLYSKFSVHSVIASLKGLQQLLNGTSVITGKDGVGFDDYLILTQNEVIYDELNNAINNAITNFSKYTTTNINELSTNVDPSACTRSTLSNREQPICALYTDLKQVADIMKGEFLAALNIQAPRVVQGDND